MAYSVKLKCKTCGHDFVEYIKDEGLDWEKVETHERKGMGEENCFQATVVVICPKCKKEITIVLEKWEYPIGSFTPPKAVEADGAEVL